MIGLTEYIDGYLTPGSRARVHAALVRLDRARTRVATAAEALERAMLLPATPAAEQAALERARVKLARIEPRWWDTFHAADRGRVDRK